MVRSGFQTVKIEYSDKTNSITSVEDPGPTDSDPTAKNKGKLSSSFLGAEIL